MSRRDFLKTTGVLTAGMMLDTELAQAQGNAGPADPKRPNILWICTDQQRADTIASLGNPNIRTPHIDRLVAEGVAFTQAFAQSPVCTPSRACFLTGRYPRTTGARRNGQAIPSHEVLVTRMLADAGYDCGLSGKLHIAPCQGRVEKRIDDGYRVFHWSHDPSPQWKENEYQQWLASKGVAWKDIYKPRGRKAFAGAPADLHQTTWCADRAIDFMKEKRNGPWLMSVNIFAPHHPFDPPKEYLDRYDPDKLPDPDYVEGELENKPVFQRVDHDGAYGGMLLGYSKMSPRERREVTAAYYAMIEHVDDNVGRMLKALEETGQRENTIVIFMSDHGELLGDHGMYLKGPHMYDCSLRVPLIFSWPGHFKAGLRSDALVELVDIVPTLLTSAGLPIPERVQGESLFDICAGTADPGRHKEQAYAEYYIGQPFHRKLKEKPLLTTLRTRTAKITSYAGLEIGELYDLQSDPGEHVNLWDDPKRKALKMEMLKRCFDASVLSQDPLPVVQADW
ncbi:MAG TPA: sulfatase-like hydrolase/transferase [Armatimonadota bacterium]